MSHLSILFFDIDKSDVFTLYYSPIGLQVFILTGLKLESKTFLQLIYLVVQYQVIIFFLLEFNNHGLR